MRADSKHVALAFAGRLADACAGGLNGLLAVILHGSLVLEDYAPGLATSTCSSSSKAHSWMRRILDLEQVAGSLQESAASCRSCAASYRNAHGGPAR
jgi:hypothetical protein